MDTHPTSPDDERSTTPQEPSVTADDSHPGDGVERPSPEGVADAELDTLRTQLEAAAELPLDQQLELFERANRIVSEQLHQLDEV